KAASEGDESTVPVTIGKVTIIIRPPPDWGTSRATGISIGFCWVSPYAGATRSIWEGFREMKPRRPPMLRLASTLSVSSGLWSTVGCVLETPQAPEDSGGWPNR